MNGHPWNANSAFIVFEYLYKYIKAKSVRNKDIL